MIAYDFEITSAIGEPTRCRVWATNTANGERFLRFDGIDPNTITPPRSSHVHP